MAKHITHEQYIQRVWQLVQKRKELTALDKQRLASTRITYGTGAEGGLRGVTWPSKWDHSCDAHGKRHKGAKGPKIGDLICIVATGQESVLQLTGTVLHEAAHVVDGCEHGHLHEWKEACKRVGLPAAINGTEYTWDCFDPALAKQLRKLPAPNDGMPLTAIAAVQLRRKQGLHIPASLQGGALATAKIKPCSAGWGVRGGTSRGAGSGSRYLKYTCAHKAGCDKPPKLRCAGTELAVSCDNCKVPYVLDDTSLPPSHGMGQSGQGVAAKTARKLGARKPLKPKRRKPKGGRTAAAQPAKAAKRVHADGGAKPPTPKAARRKAAQAGQAPLPAAPVAHPDDTLAGTVAGAEVHRKPAPQWCEPCNAPVTQCPKPAGDCEAGSK